MTFTTDEKLGLMQRMPWHPQIPLGDFLDPPGGPFFPDALGNLAQMIWIPPPYVITPDEPSVTGRENPLRRRVDDDKTAHRRTDDSTELRKRTDDARTVSRKVTPSESLRPRSKTSETYRRRSEL